ncbi:MAG TPA: A/G-specific adenine glycosylase [Candidatus Udaeobacter sp.]|nr:A/G-specific adenine glycosylase [Candidatus Udaeobacter sp.]
MRSPEHLAVFRRSLVRWYRQHGRDLPWRRTRDPYAILVSEFMLQQTQVNAVIPYYYKWLRRFPDFGSLARASENGVLRAWQGLGYYARARNLHSTAKTVTEQHGGNFPKAIEQMRQFPGIGKYTAHAVASFAFDQSVPIVEANTARVFARLFNLCESIDSHPGRRTLWQYAANLLPKSGATTFNSALLDLGALVCVTRKPKCNVCPVKLFCRAKNPGALPIRKPRRETKLLVEMHGLIVRRGWILLEQSKHRWLGMWMLPRLERSGLKQRRSRGTPVYESVFPFTHHRVTLSVYRCPAPKQIAPGQKWFESIEHVAMPSPHRRATAALLGADLSTLHEEHEIPGTVLSSDGMSNRA